MSYILDALRRADAERERGAVPSLLSQQQSIVEDDAVVARPKPLAWAVVALALALAATLAWMFFGGTTSAPRAPVEGAVTTTPAPLPAIQPPPEHAPATVTTVAPTSDAPIAPATVLAPPAPPTTSAPPVAPVANARPMHPAATPRPAPPARTSADAKPATATPALAAPPAMAKETGGARIYSPAELPEEIRRELPKVAIGGSSYSGDAASRMVMINGQVFHEGDRLAPDLVLELIRLKSAVFAYKGWRYEVAF